MLDKIMVKYGLIAYEFVVRSTFVLKCKVTSNGWTTTVIGCKTPGGVVVEPGKIIREGDTVRIKLFYALIYSANTDIVVYSVTYECISMGNGRVEIKRTYNFNPKHASCEGHGIGWSYLCFCIIFSYCSNFLVINGKSFIYRSVYIIVIISGESWVSQHNFRKTCTEKGAQISECLTDAGISVPLNQNLILSGIVYTCTQHPNGTVTINREGVPSPNNFKNNNPIIFYILAHVIGSMTIARFCSFVHVWRLRCMGYLGGVGAGGVFQLKPVEVLGPMWKRFKSLGRLLQTPSESDKKPLVISPTTETIEGPNSIQNKITCISKGVVYKPEETWISDNKFTKKCTPDGSVIILNCLMDDKTTINVNTELKLGKNVGLFSLSTGPLILSIVIMNNLAFMLCSYLVFIVLFFCRPTNATVAKKRVTYTSKLLRNKQPIKLRYLIIYKISILKAV
uniref:Sushi domain-containing protein n=1 Tax=Heterorhabditis bacteriophora TaxID=37862 RepID=A0A1I7WQG1_HETBA